MLEYLKMGYWLGRSMRRGQMTAAALMWLVYSVIIFAAIYPILNYFIQNVTTDPDCDPITRMVLPLSIPLTAVGIAFGIVVYSTPQRQY